MSTESIEKKTANEDNKKVNSTLSILLRRHEFNLFIAFVALCLVFTIGSKQFLTLDNFLIIINQISMVFIMGVGVTLIIILAGMDLSIGSVAGLAGIITAGILSRGYGTVIALIIGLLVGAFVGLFNGLIITKIGVTDFIVTLGTMSVADGLIYAYCGGNPIYQNIPKSFLFIGQGKILGIAVPILISVVVFLIGYTILSRMKLGTRIYAVGCNKEAARLSGINVENVKIFGYVFCGILSALAGIIMTSRLGSGQPTAGNTFMFDAIGAVVIGGASLSGGAGTILGTLIGVMIIGVIGNGLTLLNVSYYYQEVVKGLIIIGAVSYNSLREKYMK